LNIGGFSGNTTGNPNTGVSEVSSQPEQVKKLLIADLLKMKEGRKITMITASPILD
jgi:hypothetical protein